MNTDENCSSENKLINQCQSMDVWVIELALTLKSKWLDIGHALYFMFVDRDGACSKTNLFTVG